MPDGPLLSLRRIVQTRSRTVTALAFGAALAGLLVAAWFAYRPGITGTFLLDDFSNLPALGTTGAVTNWDAFWRYITSGTADPAGRPLSLLSFLLDAQNWPTSAAPFKLTNVLLHLVNGVLLCWAMLSLGARRGITQNRAATAALIGAGIWLLHPLFVSTTLYVVQREAMLPATFTFMGIICWCAGRNAFDAGRTVRAITWMTAGAWLCTLLAMLCKANGILLPLLLAAAETTVLAVPNEMRTRSHRIRRFASVILLGLPILLLVAYLIYVLPGLIRDTPGIRGWTVGQRMFTEPRILVDYLRLLWIPHTTSFGIFNDQTIASRNWLHPWTTLPSIVVVGGLIVAGWHVRRRFPAVAFALLFFFAGQLLESSFVPLELAFEHRNYLPAAFMFWPIGLWLSAQNTRPLIGRGIPVLVLSFLAAMTWIRADVWGNLQMQAQLWGRINPDSPQAQSFSAAVAAASGHSAAAAARLREAALRMPNQPQVALILISTECRQGAVSPRDWQLAAHSLQQANSGWNNIANWFVTTIQDATNHPCRGLTIEHLEQSLTALESNPTFSRAQRQGRAFQRVDAIIDLVTGKPQQAIATFNTMLAADPNPGDVLEQAKSLDTLGYPEFALQHLEKHASSALHAPTHGIGMPRIHAWVLRKQGWWQQQTTNLHQKLQTEIQTRAAGDAADLQGVDDVAQEGVE